LNLVALSQTHKRPKNSRSATKSGEFSGFLGGFGILGYYCSSEYASKIVFTVVVVVVGEGKSA